MHDVRFVLVRPGQGGNIGAAARALKNMGSQELWLVDPRPHDEVEAVRLAHNAVDVLEGARRVATLPEALADCRWIAGATRRGGRRRAATLSPRALASAAAAEPARRPLAIVFGPEEDGLTMAELALCHDVVRIPTDARQPSLNLAQAVLVLAYEMYVAGLDPAASAATVASEAPAEAVEQMYAHVESMLFAVRFVRTDTAPHRMLALRRMLGRARLAPGDVRLLRGIARQVLWALAHAGGTRPGVTPKTTRSSITPQPPTPRPSATPRPPVPRPSATRRAPTPRPRTPRPTPSRPRRSV